MRTNLKQLQCVTCWGMLLIRFLTLTFFLTKKVYVYLEFNNRYFLLSGFCKWIPSWSSRQTRLLQQGKVGVRCGDKLKIFLKIIEIMERWHFKTSLLTHDPYTHGFKIIWDRFEFVRIALKTGDIFDVKEVLTLVRSSDSMVDPLTYILSWLLTLEILSGWPRYKKPPKNICIKRGCVHYSSIWVFWYRRINAHVLV